MIEYIGLAILVFSLLVLIYSFIAANEETTKQTQEVQDTGREKGSKKFRRDRSPVEIEAKAVPEGLEKRAPSPVVDGRPGMAEVGKIEPEVFSERHEEASVSPPSATFDRKASLTYWERMALDNEYNLTVTLHRPDFKVVAPDGASVKESETTYKLPRSGHVRIIPVCSGCNISPASRDIRVTELDVETKAHFKVLPVKEGNYDLEVEFQIVSPDGDISPLGKEFATVTIQKKALDLTLGPLNISVSRRVPAFFSMCGSLFGFASFILARLGINLNEEILAWSMTISTGITGFVFILLAMMLLFKGLKPLMREISITLK
ncbi:MAG: membrane protein of unknown function [Candidatus Thorarchaeota archaeon]|nr:MAG: membrane protein of unknown function [Candidatus Thorarchaeota archaeon]